MTYVTEQTSAELRAHMRRLQAMPGWHNPLDDRLFKEVVEQDKEIERLRAALTQPTTVQQAETLAELRRALAAIGVVGQIDGHDVIRRLSVLEVADARCQKGGAA